MNLVINIVLIFINILFISNSGVCNSSWGNTGSTNTDTFELFLAFECCTCGTNSKDEFFGQYSLCTDGYEQLYGFPAFIHLNFEDFIESYNNPIYVKEYTAFPELTKLVTNYNTVRFYNGKFRKFINKKMKRINKNLSNFDGYFYYALFKMKFTARSLEDGVKTLPVFSPRNSSKYIIDKKVRIYEIEDIISICPVSKEEYLQHEDKGKLKTKSQ